MELTDKKGPIYSKSPLDRPGNRNSVIDYADHGRSREEMEFILAHKITPGIAEPDDMRRSTAVSVAPQSTSPSDSAAPSGRPAQSSPGQWSSAWTPRYSRRQKTSSQQHAALIGIIIWILFMLFSMIMGIVSNR